LVNAKGDPIDVTVTIEKVVAGSVTNAAKKTSKKPIVYFKNKTKGMVMNVTNCKTVGRMYGDDPREWVGKRVTLYQAETSAGGETIACIRIRQRPPGGAEKKADETPPTDPVKSDMREPGEEG
jgi:hypothetical protein